MQLKYEYEKLNIYDSTVGSMVGLAVGDALGAPVEFMPRGSFKPITKYYTGGKFGLKIGEYTDDTAMALCLAQSLIEQNGMNLKDQLGKYLAWYQHGYMSATGRSIGCGKTILMALMKFYTTGCEKCGNSRLKRGAGNGSLMRVAPVAIFYRKNLKTAMKMAAESSYATHGLKICADACMYYVALIIAALNGEEKTYILGEEYAKYISEILDSDFMDVDLLEIVRGRYKQKTVNSISSSGYVISTLEAALWAFVTTTSYEEGLVKAVNLGYDADTVGAVYGQLAGAYYGLSGIPKYLKENLINYGMIKDMSFELMRQSED